MRHVPPQLHSSVPVFDCREDPAPPVVDAMNTRTPSDPPHHVGRLACMTGLPSCGLRGALTPACMRGVRASPCAGAMTSQRSACGADADPVQDGRSSCVDLAMAFAVSWNEGYRARSCPKSRVEQLRVSIELVRRPPRAHGLQAPQRGGVPAPAARRAHERERITRPDTPDVDAETAPRTPTEVVALIVGTSASPKGQALCLRGPSPAARTACIDLHRPLKPDVTRFEAASSRSPPRASAVTSL